MLSASPFFVVEEAISKAVARSVTIHPTYKLGSGLRSRAHSLLATRHRKLLVLCPTNLVRWHAEVYVREGIPSRTVYSPSGIEAILQEFDDEETGVLVVSKGLCDFPWSSQTATCIVLSEMFVMALSPELTQMTTRAARLSEIHLVGCEYGGVSAGATHSVADDSPSRHAALHDNKGGGDPALVVWIDMVTGSALAEPLFTCEWSWVRPACRC